MAISADQLKELYGLSTDDLNFIRSFGSEIGDRFGPIVDEWYAWLQTQPEFDQYFSDPDVLSRVQDLQWDYWQRFMAADIDDEYVANRRRVGETHARIGLPLSTYFAGMNRFQDLLMPIAADTEIPDTDGIAMAARISKLMHLDTALVVEMYNEVIEDTLTAQSKALLEMSTPVTQIWDGILLLPIVGLIDSTRARDIMNATLSKIGETQARMFILDISGVGVVDTAVANNLIKITRATALMGCSSTISGVSPSIAQTIVDLGIDVGQIKTTSTMQDALSDAFRRIGMKIEPVG